MYPKSRSMNKNIHSNMILVFILHRLKFMIINFILFKTTRERESQTFKDKHSATLTFTTLL